MVTYVKHLYSSRGLVTHHLLSVALILLQEVLTLSAKEQRRQMILNTLEGAELL